MNDVKSANELGWGDIKIEELRNEIVKAQVRERNHMLSFVLWMYA